MTNQQYRIRLKEWFIERGMDGIGASEWANDLMDDWLWKQMDHDARQAAVRAAEYSYGGTHRHPLDMD